VRAIDVVVTDIVLDETAEVSLVEDKYVIQKISATASDPTLGYSILPRACGGYAFRSDAAGGKQIGCLLTKLAVTIQNRIPVKTRFRECLPELLRYPEAARVFCDIEMENLASAMFDNEKAVQHAKSQSRQGEEVHGRDDVSVIAEERRPELAGIVGRRPAPEIAGDGALGNVQAKLEELAVNSRSAPGGILVRHPPDERSNFAIDLGPAQAPGARSQAPEQPKASPMPGDNRFWFDDNQDVAPGRPKPAEKGPKHSILDSEPSARMFSLEYAQLLT